MKARQIILIFLLVFFLACKKDSKTEIDLSNIEIDTEVYRFDKAFASSGPDDLPYLKASYPYLFPSEVPDSIWIQKMSDTLQAELEEEVFKEFHDFETQRKDLNLLFKHVKYYFPNFHAPKVVTLTSDVQYDSRVVFADSLLLIGLDNYLGSDHYFYENISAYIGQQLDSQFLMADVASATAKAYQYPPKSFTFLDRMIYYGKELHLISKFAPWLTPNQKMRYTVDQWNWAIANEAQIWAYFIENDMLYSTDQDLDRRFLDMAPFSKFGLELDSESPGRIGRMIGWRIVTAFEDNNPEITLSELMQMNAEEIFRLSRYKPQK